MLTEIKERCFVSLCPRLLLRSGTMGGGGLPMAGEELTEARRDGRESSSGWGNLRQAALPLRITLTMSSDRSRSDSSRSTPSAVFCRTASPFQSSESDSATWRQRRLTAASFLGARRSASRQDEKTCASVSVGSLEEDAISRVGGGAAGGLWGLYLARDMNGEVARRERSVGGVFGRASPGVL